MTVTGIFTGAGPFLTIAARFLNSVAGSSTITATVIGTDLALPSGDAYVTLGFNSSTANTVFVTLTTAAGGLSGFTPAGDIKLEISGNPYRIERV